VIDEVYLPHVGDEVRFRDGGGTDVATLYRVTSSDLGAPPSENGASRRP
jgi:hypothetical protein